MLLCLWWCHCCSGVVVVVVEVVMEVISDILLCVLDEGPSGATSFYVQCSVGYVVAIIEESWMNGTERENE